MFRRLFEFNCECTVFRDQVQIGIKGQNGRLRKILLKEILKPKEAIEKEQIKVKDIPSDNHLKQTSLDMFMVQQPKLPEQPKPTEKNPPKQISQESVFVLQIFQNTEKLHDFNIRNLIQINKNFIQEGKISLILSENNQGQMQQISVHLNNSTQATLQLLMEQIIKIKIIKQGVKQVTQNTNNSSNPVRKVIENPQKSETSENSNNIVKSQNKNPGIVPTKQLNELQIMKMRRKGIYIEDIAAIQKQIGGQAKILKLVQQQSIGLLDLPRSLLVQIFEFFEQKKLYQLRVTCKMFRDETCEVIKVLSFQKFIEVPHEILLTLLEKMKRIEKFVLGRAKNIKIKTLLDNYIPNFSFIKTLDLGDYTYLNDKLCIKFIEKSERTQVIILPYNSKITDAAISYLTKRLQSIRSFQLRQNSNELNEHLSETSLSEFFIKRFSQIEMLKLPYIHISFFQHLYKNGLKLDEATPLKCLKFKGIYMSKEEQEENYFSMLFQQCQQLEQLAIKFISVKIISIFNASSSLNKQLEESFTHLKGLKILKLGEFCTDNMCQMVAKQLTQLKTIKVKSKSVSDKGLMEIFIECKDLYTIDVAGCIRINGHCFENLPYNFRKIITVIVQFDDFRLECLDQILSEKGYIHEIQNQKSQKNKY